MKRFTAALALCIVAIGTMMAMGAQAQTDPPEDRKTMPRDLRNNPIPTVSGPAEFRDETLGTGLTECPQAGTPADNNPKPLDRRNKDKVEQLSEGGDDVRTNSPEYSCFPQNETAVDVNPTNFRNVVTGQNDYRLGWGTSGVNASTDGGNHWYTAIMPFPSLPSGDNLDGGGDPAIAFDRAGLVYYAEINFNRTDDTNGIWVLRSSNGGFTWSRPCVAINVGTPQDDQARCGGPGDPRRPGDGTVVFQQDNDSPPPGGSSANFSVTFHDKEYIATGPRPAGVTPVCFGPETKTPIPAGQPGCPNEIIGVDRIYVTWTAFNNPVGTPGFVTSSTIEASYSDDQGRSWSPRRTINGAAAFCSFAFASLTGCDDNQFSVPSVNPTTGHVYVAFENFNTTDENQILSVRSRDGGNTWEGPFYVTAQYDVNLRLTAGCVARGAGRVHLTNSCFRVPMTLGMVADRRGGEFADDLYLVMSDNRNGTPVNTNTDVFFFTSKDGGTTWIGPTRVNNDASSQPANRDCGRNPPGPETNQPCPPASVHTGNDQWWPWIDVSSKGDLNIVFHDRRLDTDSVAHEWPTDRLRPGNYLVWTWGAQCSITSTASVTTGATTVPRAASQCLAPTAAPIPQPAGPVNPTASELLVNQTVFPFDNFAVSDVPSNFDYCFRAGIFCGDYNGVGIADGDSTAYGHFTDARNGRSSRNQPGRNPACEQSDVFTDKWSAQSHGNQNAGQQFSEYFLVTPCPTDIQDKGSSQTP